VLAGWGGVFPLVAGALAFKSGHVVNRSRVLTFALDGAARLPPAVAPAQRVMAPPSVHIEPALAAEGAKQYARRCGSCHGDGAVSGGLVPDLRFSPALSNEALWNAVIDAGALESHGMVSFKSVLDAHEQAAVRAYLIERAQESDAARRR